MKNPASCKNTNSYSTFWRQENIPHIFQPIVIKTFLKKETIFGVRKNDNVKQKIMLKLCIANYYLYNQLKTYFNWNSNKIIRFEVDIRFQVK